MFVFDTPAARCFQAQVEELLRRLPALEGAPIRIQCGHGMRGPGGEIHAGAFLRERRILFDTGLRRKTGEFARIFTHELFHFAWLRLGNTRRRSYEELIAGEQVRRAKGELGWSAEWRKKALHRGDRARRTRRWREYVCESFCDTAAWRLAGLAGHPEFTLAPPWRRLRRAWFEEYIVTERLSI